MRPLSIDTFNPFCYSPRGSTPFLIDAPSTHEH